MYIRTQRALAVGVSDMFGWSIVVKQDNNIIVDVYPARVKYRGFSEKTNTEGYKKVSKYLQENINELVKESDE